MKMYYSFTLSLSKLNRKLIVKLWLISIWAIIWPQNTKFQQSTLNEQLQKQILSAIIHLQYLHSYYKRCNQNNFAMKTSQTPGVSVCWHIKRQAWNTHIITHAELFTQWGRKRVGRVGGGVSCSSLLISLPNLIAAQQWNKTDFHCCMPAQFKLVPA